MKKRVIKSAIKSATILGVLITVLFSVTACSEVIRKLDVVGKKSITAFEEILELMQDKVEEDKTNGSWSLLAPDGTVRFIWSENWEQSPLYDVMLKLDAKPFINAGLDPAKLPENYAYDQDMLMVGTKLGEDALTYDKDITPLAAYEQIVNLKRDSISYHMVLDHYGISLGEGNLFEWAKDTAANDKDIVFVLNPEPLILAGVDPDKVEGWFFAKVKVDVNGKPREVDKFLKPFDLK